MYYDFFGNPLTEIYDFSGNVIASSLKWAEKVETADYYDSSYTGIPAVYQSGIKGAIDLINASDDDCYGIVCIGDMHNTDNNEATFIEGFADVTKFSRFIWCGDTADKFEQIDDAVESMQKNAKIHRIVAMGNHEWMHFTTPDADIDPVSKYSPLVDSFDSDLLDGHLAYYSDDDDRNVRYIVLDTSSGKKDWETFNVSDAQKSWLQSVLPTDGKDVIFVAHAMINPFTLVGASESGNIGDVKSSSNSSQQVTDKVVPVIQSYAGNVIGYLSGHYHTPGYSTDDGFNMITGPSPKSYYIGLSFFMVNRKTKVLTWLLCHKTEQCYYRYDFTY